MQRFINAVTKQARNSYVNNYVYGASRELKYRCLSQAVVDHKTNKSKKTFNFSDFILHVNSGKVFYLKQLKNVFHTIDFANLKTEEAALLFKVCGSAVKDSPRDQRNEICQNLFKGLQECKNINNSILNSYIKACTENSVNAYNADLLKSELNSDTYKLLLENVCELGRIQDAFEILEAMKNSDISLDSDCISSLVLAHTINGGLKAASAVLDTMRTAQIFKNDKALHAIYKGLIKRNDLLEFREAVQIYPVVFTEDDLLNILEEMGLKGVESWLDEIHTYYKHIPNSLEMQSKIEKICLHLIHMKQPQSAANIYRKFVSPQPDEVYGLAILKEMLHCDVDIHVIISIARSFLEPELNPHLVEDRKLKPDLLESITQLALKFKYQKQAWILLEQLEVVRPHYFWPLLVQNGNSKGEAGVFETLKRIKPFNVKLDVETLEHYIIPYCDLSNLKLLSWKLKEEGFTVREFLSPLLNVLLKQNKTRKAAELCTIYYGVNVSGDCFLPLLAKAWAFTKDPASIVKLLARYCESNAGGQDWAGTFLIHGAKYCHRQEILQEYFKLIQLVQKQRLKITTQSADIIKELCKSHISPDLLDDFNVRINGLVDFQLTLAEDTSFLPHPKNMDLDGLESHLIELKEKNMETRGILRKLIQLHASKGNFQRVTELQQVFLDSGYEVSAGMKSSVMHNFIRGGHVNEAMELYDELKVGHPSFALDSFKFIDLARLLIQSDRFDEAVAILEEETLKCKPGNVHSIERNCKELLDACKSPAQIDQIFTLLHNNGLCLTSNVILGPLVKVHLRSGDVSSAVDKYVKLSNKYQCTPMQLELLCAVAKQENPNLLGKVLAATESVHGPVATQVGLIAALAENEQENALRKALANLTVPIHTVFQKRCSRWVEERKIKPLQYLAKASTRVTQQFVDMDFVYKCIVEIYDLNNDYAGAVSFLNELPEDVRSVSLEQEVSRICNKGKTKNRFASAS